MARNACLDAELDEAVAGEAAAFLLAVNGPHRGQVYPVLRNTVILGRSRSADIRISHGSVSNEHARLTSGRQGFEIEDLGSTNGTYRDGERVTRARLESGDRLVLGSVELAFLLDRAQEDATVALLPPGARPAAGAGSTLAPVLVRPAEPYWRAERSLPVEGPRRGGEGRAGEEQAEGPSLEELAGQVITTYRFLRPYAPLLAALGGAGLVLGLASARLVPPAPVAMAEARVQPARKSNPVDHGWRPPEQSGLQFFAEAERAFTHRAQVAATLKKLEGGAARRGGAATEPDPRRVNTLAGRLKLEPIGERLYRATYREPLVGRGRPHPVAFLAAHIESYRESEIDKALRGLREEADFLQAKWAAADRDLRAINGQLAELKQANAGGLPETALQANASRFALDSRRGELRARIARLEGELAADARLLEAGSPMAQARFAASRTFRDSLATLERRLNEAQAAGLGERHPEVVKIEQDIAGLKKLIDREMAAQTTEADRSANAGHAQLTNRIDMSRAALAAARRELKEVEGRLTQLDRLVVRMPEVAARLEDLQRTHEATRKLHDQLFEQYQKARLQIDIERPAARSRFEVITPPSLSQPTAARTYGLRAAMGLSLALLLVAAIIAAREGRKLFRRALATLDGRCAG